MIANSESVVEPSIFNLGNYHSTRSYDPCIQSGTLSHISESHPDAVPQKMMLEHDCIILQHSTNVKRCQIGLFMRVDYSDIYSEQGNRCAMTVDTYHEVIQSYR